MRVKKHLNTLVKAIMAGFMIGLSGVMYLVIGKAYPIFAAAIFGFGFLTVLASKFALYTGRICHLIDERPRYIIDILLLIIGNLIGTGVIAGIVVMMNNPSMILYGIELFDLRLERASLDIFGASILCGMLMYIATESYRRVKNDVAKVFMVITAVAISILSGNLHVVAEMFFLFVAKPWTLDSWIYLVIVLIGNGIGAIIFHLLEKIAGTEQEIKNS